uniref:Uncharacterized protein n=1 Tax=Romanomermis culicivorax TaxID=13658 RepID=A0A915LAL8_ROMCU
MSFDDARDTGQSSSASSAASSQQEPKFTLALVLETLSDLCSKSNENAAKRDDLMAELRETCPYWKKDDMIESRKLVDEVRQIFLCKMYTRS